MTSADAPAREHAVDRARIDLAADLVELDLVRCRCRRGTGSILITLLTAATCLVAARCAASRQSELETSWQPARRKPDWQPRTIRQSPHVGGEQMDLAFAQHVLERRHRERSLRHVEVAAAHDAFGDRGLGAAEQPDVVREVRRADRRVALAFRAMARRAVLREQRLAELRRQLVVRQADSERTYATTFLTPSGPSAGTERRHHAEASVGDRRLDVSPARRRRANRCR